MLTAKSNKLKEEMRCLGIKPQCRGMMYIQQVVEGNRNFKDLHSKEHELIVEAWESRYFIPGNVFNSMESANHENVIAVRVKPEKENNESVKQYNKRFSKNIIEFFARV